MVSISARKRAKKHSHKRKISINKPTFDVVVVATMSAGKSTVINALIGQELLHSAHEATTATITRIHNKDGAKHFSARAYGYTNEILAEKDIIDADTLKTWNVHPAIKTIDLTGDIIALKNDDAELVIYDTPGPNNSQDGNHESLTMEIIEDGNYGMILYVLNATQLGVHDDRHLLEKIYTNLKNDGHKEIIFLLNKADCLDPEKGETIEQSVQKTTQYLNNIGFENPVIIPTAANLALLAKKALHQHSLSDDECLSLNIYFRRKNKKNFSQDATISQHIKDKLNNLLTGEVSPSILQNKEDTPYSKKNLEDMIIRCGFASVNHYLQNKLSYSTQPN